jgi:hypothetical protein
MHPQKKILEALIQKEKFLIKHCQVNDWVIAKEQHEAMLEMYTEQLINLKAQTTETGYHFLNVLNDEQRLAFVNNYVDYNYGANSNGYTLSEFLDRKYESIFECLGSAFDWGKSKEGAEYWAEIVSNHL